MPYIEMPNGDMIAQTQKDADTVPEGYRRDEKDRRRVHLLVPLLQGKKQKGCKNCRGL